MRGLMLIACAGLLATSAQAQTGGRDAALAREIVALEQARLTAFRNNDRPAYSRLVADDLTMIHSNGEIAGKRDEMGFMRPSTAERPLPTLGLEDTQVRGFGNAAVLTGSLVERNGARVALRLRFTNVYARRGGRWVLVAGQLTRAVEP